MTVGQRLQRAAEREAAAQAGAVRAFEADLRRVWGSVARQLRTLVGEWQSGRQGRARMIDLARVLALRGRVRELFRAAGYDDAALLAIGTPLDRLASQILGSSRIANEVASFPPVSLEALQAWRSVRYGELLAIAEEAARVVQRVALDGTLGLRPVAALVLDLMDALEVSHRQARTYYDTAVSIFARQMALAQITGEPDELFFYVGPMDVKTRPFCAEWVGRVRTRAVIDELDNGQLPDPLVTGGGYNCRHQWKRVSVFDEELRELAGTGARASWIQAQVDAMRRAA